MIAARRLARGIGRTGFGNAGDVRTLFEKSVTTAIGRGVASQPNIRYPQLKIKVIDVIGPDPTTPGNIPLLGKALAMLDEYTGLKEVKNAINELHLSAAENYKLELAGYETHQFSLNRLFLGNPGTGKTSIAKIYGMVLKALGYLSDGTVEYKRASDFIGGAVGQSQTKTAEILRNCEGKVLLIDEVCLYFYYSCSLYTYLFVIVLSLMLRFHTNFLP